MTCTVATGSIGSRNNTVPRLLRSVTRTLAPAVSPLAIRCRCCRRVCRVCQVASAITVMAPSTSRVTVRIWPDPSDAGVTLGSFGSMPGSIRPLAENHMAERQRPSPKTRPDLRFCGADDEI